MERRCSVGHKLGMACVYDPISLIDGPAVFERSLVIARQTKNDSMIGRSAYWLGYICYAGGSPKKALVHLKEASDAAIRCNDIKLIAQINATLGQTHLSICNYDQALVLLEGAVDSKRKTARPGSGIAVGSAYSLGCKGGLLADQGHFDQAQACFDESLLLLGNSKHQVASSVLNWVGLAYLWQGRWEDALATGERSVTIAGNIRSTQLYSFSRSLNAYSRWLLDRNERDLNELRVAVQWIAERRGTLLSSMIYGWLVDAAVQIGETSEARAYAAKILRRSRVDDRIGEAMGCRSLALLAARKNDSVAVNRYLHYAERSAVIRGSAHEAAQNLFCRARCEALAGSSEAAATLRNQALVQFERLGMTRDASHARGFNLNAL
jgi:tetratricopeptide (TPR) repeat protein